MKRKYLIIVDMQKDFVYGCLGSEEAKRIVPDIVKKAEEFDGTVIFTKDTHREDYLQTQEGEKLPVPHCIYLSDGWKLVEELEDFQRQLDCPVYEKETFGCLKLAEDLKAENDTRPIESIELCGVCTDICVVSNALLLKAYMPEVPIYADGSCCAGVTPETHNHALETMKSCQITIK